MNFIVPTPKDKYLSNSKYRTDLKLLIVKFWKQFLEAVLERINRFLSHPPYVSQYSLRTEIQHAQIRAKLANACKNCQHLKGNIRGEKNGRTIHTDYNVSFFRFIDGTIRIRCNTCGKKWFPTDENWDAAVFMVRNSTNHPASSEMPPEILNNLRYKIFQEVFNGKGLSSLVQKETSPVRKTNISGQGTSRKTDGAQ